MLITHFVINRFLLMKLGLFTRVLRDENYIFYLLVGQKIIFMIYEAPPRILKKSGYLVCTTD